MTHISEAMCPCHVYTFWILLKGALCSFEKKFKLRIIIYNIHEVIIQTQKYLFHEQPRTLFEARKVAGSVTYK